MVGSAVVAIVVDAPVPLGCEAEEDVPSSFLELASSLLGIELTGRAVVDTLLLLAITLRFEGTPSAKEDRYCK